MRSVRLAEAERYELRGDFSPGGRGSAGTGLSFHFLSSSLSLSATLSATGTSPRTDVTDGSPLLPLPTGLMSLSSLPTGLMSLLSLSPHWTDETDRSLSTLD